MVTAPHPLPEKRQQSDDVRGNVVRESAEELAFQSVIEVTRLLLATRGFARILDEDTRSKITKEVLDEFAPRIVSGVQHATRDEAIALSRLNLEIDVQAIDDTLLAVLQRQGLMEPQEAEEILPIS